jgi:hypothetical protein
MGKPTKALALLFGFCSYAFAVFVNWGMSTQYMDFVIKRSLSESLWSTLGFQTLSVVSGLASKDCVWTIFSGEYFTTFLEAPVRSWPPDPEQLGVGSLSPLEWLKCNGGGDLRVGNVTWDLLDSRGSNQLWSKLQRDLKPPLPKETNGIVTWPVTSRDKSG